MKTEGCFLELKVKTAATKLQVFCNSDFTYIFREMCFFRVKLVIFQTKTVFKAVKEQENMDRMLATILTSGGKKTPLSSQ